MCLTQGKAVIQNLTRMHAGYTSSTCIEISNVARQWQNCIIPGSQVGQVLDSSIVIHVVAGCSERCIIEQRREVLESLVSARDRGLAQLAERKLLRVVVEICILSMIRPSLIQPMIAC